MDAQVQELDKSLKMSQDVQIGEESYQSPSNGKRAISDSIKRFGTSASAALFNPDCQVFQAPNIKGMIGYKSTAGCLVVYGEPICSPDDVVLLTDAFYMFARKHRKSILFVTVSEKFTYWAKKQFGGSYIEVCEEEVINPTIHADPSEGSDGRMLRKKINHAIHDGAQAFEYLEQDQNLETALNEALDTWVNARKGPQIFQSHIELFSDRRGKRWFYAKKDGKIVGVATLNRMDSRQGWLLHLLMATPDAPNGTTEMIVMKILNTLRSEKCTFLTFGATPRKELGEIEGLGKLSTAFARFAFKSVVKFFRIDGRRVYWKKFMPDNERSFVLCSKPRVGLRELFAIMKAMNASF